MTEPAPRIYSRAAWGARSPRCTTFRPLTQIETVFGHYTDQHETIPSPAHVHDVLVVQAIQRYHIDVRGYCDIAYGALVGGNGDIYQGRPTYVDEAGVLGHNPTEFSIAFLSDGPITAEQKRSFEFLLWLAILNFPNVAHTPEPHSAAVATQCPGDEIRAFLATIRL